METGLSMTKKVKVTEDMLASNIGSGDVRVLATPAMIAGIENVCKECVKDHIGEGNTTVGTRIEVSHIAATPLSMEVTYECELCAVDGRRIIFNVSARDEKEVISEGKHERVIVNLEKFQARADGKIG